MRFIRDIITPVIVALVIFALLQVTVGSFKIHGSSMLPNIQQDECIIVNKAAYFFHSPQSGEVVVLHSPLNPNSDLIKRIIALPGDTIEIKDGTVIVNNVPLVEDYIQEKPNYTFLSQEILPDHYFVLGDNRNNSSDSHKGWTVPRENIVGKVWFVYWPLQKWSLIKHYTPSADKQAAKIGNPSSTLRMLCPMK